MKAIAGILIVALHFAGFVYVANRSHGSELAIVAPPLVVAGGADSALGAAAPDGAAVAPNGGAAAPNGGTVAGNRGPGLVHTRWSKSYRGGYTRSVGATQLVGPFQDPTQPVCSGRIVVGQRMLEQVADVMKAQIETELRGMEVFPVGMYQRVKKVALRWAKDHILVSAVVSFKRVDVPITVKLYPERTGGKPGLFDRLGPDAGKVPKPAALRFRIVAQADLDFDNRVLDWVSDKVGADELATRITREQIDDVLVTTFAPPPPFELSEGQTLTFTYCDGPIEIVENAFGALPFAVSIGRLAAAAPAATSSGAPAAAGIGATGGGGATRSVATAATGGTAAAGSGAGAAAGSGAGVAAGSKAGAASGSGAASLEVLPPRFGVGSRPPPSADTTIAIDLDVDALDALLFELWRTGWLDKRLAEVGLDGRFNTDPIVTEYLSIRISPLRLALPPVIAPNGDGSLRLAADARVSIGDGTRSTVGRVYGALDFRFAATSSAATNSALPLSVDLGALELSCERDSATLVPCYGDLVAALRDRGDQFHGALTEAFATLLSDIFVDRRIGAEGLPADIVIERAVPTLAAGGTLHLELGARLVPAP